MFFYIEKEEVLMSDWMEAISEISQRNRDTINKLSPNKMQVNTIKSYTRAVNDRVNYIDCISLLRHEGIIDFETAQKLIDVQKDWLKQDIEYLKQYLGIE